MPGGMRVPKQCQPMVGSRNFRVSRPTRPLRLPRRLAPRTVPDVATAAGHSCAMNTQPCFKGLSGIGRMRRFGGTAGGVSTRFRGGEDRIRKLGAFGAWLCCVLLLGLGVSPAAIAQATVTYIHTDALGSVVAESDANGNVIKRYDYEPYGAVVGGQVTDGPGYTGHVSDSATGLSYMQQRYMDPQLGVFLSVDPVTAYDQPVGQFNRYRYAAGNPYRYIDPDGRAESPAWMRYTIPGQATWDAAVTSAEQGNYGMAAAGGAVAIAEGVLGIVTLGQSQRLTISSQLVSKEIAALSAARSASAEAQASKAAGGGVTGLVTESGEVFVGASSRAGGPGGASNAAIQKSLDGVADGIRSPFHGCCGEIDAMSKALNSGADLKGATMATVRAVGSKAGQVMEPCTSCAAVAKDQGVRTVLPVKTQPL